MRVITIVKNCTTMPHSYNVKTASEGRTLKKDRLNAGAAAAQAVDWATSQKSGYVVVGDDDVMARIPKNLHNSL